MVMLQRPDPSSGSPPDAKQPVLLVAALADIGVTGEHTAAAAAFSLGVLHSVCCWQGCAGSS